MLLARQISRRCLTSFHDMGHRRHSIFQFQPWKLLNRADLCRLMCKTLCTVLDGICSLLFEAGIDTGRLSMRVFLLRSTHYRGVRGFPANFSRDTPRSPQFVVPKPNAFAWLSFPSTLTYAPTSNNCQSLHANNSHYAPSLAAWPLLLGMTDAAQGHQLEHVCWWRIDKNS